MKSFQIFLAVFVVQAVTSMVSAAVVFPPALVHSDTDYADAFVFSQNGKGSNKTIVDILKDNKLADMADLINRAGLTKNLTSKDNFTVLAPSDAAMDNLPYNIRRELLTNDTFTKTFIEYHIIKGRVPSSSIQQDQINSTLLPGRMVRFNHYTVDSKQEITVNGAVLERVDLNASNGVVHVVGKSLWPQAEYNMVDAISHIEDLSAFSKILNDAKMNGTFSGTGHFTIFAPTNEAFKAHGKVKNVVNTVNYHSINGTNYSAGLNDKEKLTTMYKAAFGLSTELTIQVKDGQVSVKGKHETAHVTVADIPVNNGVLHVIDTVLTPPRL